MNRIIKKFVSFVDMVAKETIVFTGSVVLDGAFMYAFAQIFKTYIKNDKVLHILTMVFGIIASPILIKFMKKQLGYSEEDCKNMYDLMKEICDSIELKKKLETV